MTYCIGIKLDSGIIALADTRISAGTAIMGAKKINTITGNKKSFFYMVSGLKSVGDKVSTYFEEAYSRDAETFTKLFQVVNLLGAQIKKAAAEDREGLSRNGYKFDIHCIVGGQLSGDVSPRMYTIYPEGNWMEISDETPYAIIGNTKYGKAVLNMGLTSEVTQETALKLAYLSFEMTRVSCNDVGYPIDLLTYGNGNFHFRETRLTRKELSGLESVWKQSFLHAIDGLPNDWARDLTEDDGFDGSIIALENRIRYEMQQAGYSGARAQGSQDGDGELSQGE